MEIKRRFFKIRSDLKRTKASFQRKINDRFWKSMKRAR